MPQIKQHVTQAVEVAQKSMEQVDMKKVSNKIQQSVQQIKAKIEKLKKSSKNSDIEIKVNNKEAQKQISQLEKQIDSLQKKISASQIKLSTITPQLDSITENTAREVTPDGISSNNPAIQKTIDNSLASNKEYASLLKQENKLTQEIRQYNTQLEEAKNKVSQLKQEMQQTSTSQNKLTSFFNVFRQKVSQVKPMISNMKKSFGQMPNITQRITNNIKVMGKSTKQGLSHIFKYAGALFSLRGIYSVLSNSAQSWLSSQNSGAQQLSANIEYMKYAMGSVFAPVIEYVINLVYQLMKAIQSVVYAFSGINIFAKATASSMNKTASSASKASKSLAGVHNEINNVSEKDSSGGSGSVSPSMDLSTVDGQMSSFTQKLYNFFKPLKESWDTYGEGLITQIKTTVEQVATLISSVWKSFENIITNGTAYLILQNILAIIGDIAEAFANAWKNDGNGEKIIQNLANALNNVLNIMQKIVESTVFQWILNTGVSAIEKLTKAVEWVTKKIDEFIGFLTGSEEDLDGWAILIGSIATAIGLVCTALALYNVVSGIAAIVTTALTSPITLVIIAIAALIAIIVLCVKHWETIKETILNVIDKIKVGISTALNKIKETWTNIWNTIKRVVSNVWNGIWGIIKGVVNNILGGIERFVNGVIRGINFVLKGISKVANAVGSLIGLNPISLQLSTISLPRLAKGGVIDNPTIAMMGEYSGAKTNPEIVTPQNIMYDTMVRALSDTDFNNGNNGQPIYLTVNVGNERLGRILLNDLRNMTRQTGQGIEALVGG